jgi:hypothetical protein
MVKALFCACNGEKSDTRRKEAMILFMTSLDGEFG